MLHARSTRNLRPEIAANDCSFIRQRELHFSRMPFRRRQHVMGNNEREMGRRVRLFYFHRDSRFTRGSFEQLRNSFHLLSRFLYLRQVFNVIRSLRTFLQADSFIFSLTLRMALILESTRRYGIKFCQFLALQDLSV